VPGWNINNTLHQDAETISRQVNKPCRVKPWSIFPHFKIFHIHLEGGGGGGTCHTSVV